MHSIGADHASAGATMHSIGWDLWRGSQGLR
jgi:hypothetical protein